jgi:hypothetical protein
LEGKQIVYFLIKEMVALDGKLSNKKVKKTNAITISM